MQNNVNTNIVFNFVSSFGISIVVSFVFNIKISFMIKFNISFNINVAVNKKVENKRAFSPPGAMLELNMYDFSAILGRCSCSKRKQSAGNGVNKLAKCKQSRLH